MTRRRIERIDLQWSPVGHLPVFRWINLQWSAGGPMPVLAEVFGVFCVHEVPMRFGAEYRVSHIDGRGTHPVSDGMSYADAVQIAERMNGVPLDDPDAWAIAEAIFGEVIGG